MQAGFIARLLGPPSFAYEGQPLVIRSRKAAAVLAYLSLKEAGATRDELAETFWQLGKLANVRQALYDLRKLPGARTWLHDEGDLVRVEAETDVELFEAAIASSDFATAVGLYRGEFLTDGFGLNEAPFLEWLATQRERLSTRYLAALVGHAERLAASGQWREAGLLVTRALRHDPYDERLWRAGMRLAHVQGGSDAALALYRDCVARLDEDLGTAPQGETRELADAIARGDSVHAPGRPEALPAAQLRLLQAAVVGEGMLGIHDLAAVLESSVFETADDLAVLQRGGWLDEHLQVLGGRHEAIRQSLTPSFKRLLHERIAGTLITASHVADAAIARHLLAAADPHAAAPRLLAAARTAIDKGALADATTYLYRAAWAAYELPEVRLEATVLLEGVAAQRGDGALQAAALTVAERLAQDLQDDSRLVDVKLRRSRQLLAQGQVGDGMDMALQALEIATRVSDGVLLARARNAVGAAHYYAGDLDGAAQTFATNLEADDLIERYRAYNNLASLAGMRGRTEEAYGRFEEALTLARQIGPQADVAATLNNLAATADRMGEYDKAVRHFREGIAVSRRNQAVDREGRMLTNLAAVYSRQGQLGPAWNTAVEVEELAAEIDSLRLKLAATELKADVQRLCGLLEPARVNLEAALTLAGRLEDERKVLTLTAQLRTLAALVSSDGSEAVAAIAALDQVGLADNAPWLWLDLALTARSAPEALAYVRNVSSEGRFKHHRVIADIAMLRAARLRDADERCRTLASEASLRLTRSLPDTQIVERPLGRLLLTVSATHGAPVAPTSCAVPASVAAEVAEQGAGLPRAMRESLLAQPAAWLASMNT